MTDYAISRAPGNFTGHASHDAMLRAQQQYEQTGVVPHGYTVLPNGMVHPTSDMRNFMDRHGWQLMAALPAAGVGIGLAAGAGGAAAAVPDLPMTTGMDGLSFGEGVSTLPGTALGMEAAPSVAGHAATAGSSATVAGGSHVAGPASMFDRTIPHTGLSGRDAAGLGALALSLFGGNGNAEPPQNAAMNDLIRLQTERLRQADPLYQAVLRMAMGLLPTSMRGALPGQAATPPMPTMPAQPRHR